MGKVGRIILLLLMSVEGHALVVVESWDDTAIQNRYMSEEAAYSRLLSFLSYEGPFGIVSTAVYRIYDDIDTGRLKSEAAQCAKIAKNNILRGLSCALSRADEYLAEVEEVNGLCRVGAEVTRILVNNLGYWQLKAWNRNLTLDSYGHVVNGIRVSTEAGNFDYVVDVGNWGSELFPLNRAAKNYHFQTTGLPAVMTGSRPFPEMNTF